MSTPAEQPYEPGAIPQDKPGHAGPHDEVVSRPRRKLAKSKTGYTWTGLVIAALLGILVLIFILQNPDKADMQLLFWNFAIPLGVLVLLSAIIGALVMALVGGARIIQLRRAAKRG